MQLTHITLFTFTALAATIGVLHDGGRGAAPQKVAQKAAQQPAPKLEALGWLAGSWSAESARGGSTEEHWIPPKGGLMLGVNRGIRNGHASFEFLRIQETSKGIVYFASPGGQRPTAFPLTELTGSKVIFANPRHDFPQKIIYRLEGDTMHVRIEGDMNGKQRAMGWTWKRTNPTGNPPKSNLRR